MTSDNKVPPQAVPAKILPEIALKAGSSALLPALSQAAPVDYLPANMRLRVIGFLAQNNDWDGVVLVQGDGVTHWVHVSADEVVSFQSFLTGRLAKALGVGANTISDPQAIHDTMARPERLATHLRSAEVARNSPACLGHLIGAELTAARPYWLGQRMALIAEPAILENYRAPLLAQGVPLETANPQDMTDAGKTALLQL